MRNLCLIFFSVYCLLTGQTKSEIEILNRMIDSSFFPVQDFLLQDSISNVSIEITSDDDKISSLIKSKILSKVSENQSSRYQLEVVVSKSEIRYPEIVSFPLFGEEKLKREIELDLIFSLNEFNTDVFYHHYYNVYTDTIPISAIRLSGSVPDSSRKLPIIPIWRSLVEPAIISATTGLIVYLFFIVRSK